MELVINTYGSYIHKKGDCFEIKSDGKVSDLSVHKVSSIMITTSAYVSTDAIKLAMDHNIDFIFLDKYGEPYGRVWHSKLGSTTLIRRRQLEISQTDEGLMLALEWIGTKLDNQVEHLVSLRKTRSRKSAEITVYIDQLKNCRKKLASLNGNIDDTREVLMGLEGSGGRAYFAALSSVLPEKFKFEGRSRNPAKDEFNTLLNYAYGVLYSKVERGCIIAGIDPYVGIIHKDHYNKKSMVFDMIENFRIWADIVVVKLFAARSVKKEHVDRLKNGFTLNKEGKKLLIENLNAFFDESIRYKGRNIKRVNIIQFECHRVANSLIKGQDCE